MDLPVDFSMRVDLEDRCHKNLRSQHGELLFSPIVSLGNELERLSDAIWDSASIAFRTRRCSRSDPAIKRYRCSKRRRMLFQWLDCELPLLSPDLF